MHAASHAYFLCRERASAREKLDVFLSLLNRKRGREREGETEGARTKGHEHKRQLMRHAMRFAYLCARLASGKREVEAFEGRTPEIDEDFVIKWVARESAHPTSRLFFPAPAPPTPRASALCCEMRIVSFFRRF